MKRTIIILLLLLSNIAFSQGKRKLIGNKLQILDLKNAKILGLDSKGNAYDNSEYVQNKIDDLEIGTRNLIINRQDFELSNDGAVSNSNVYTTQDNGTTIWRVERDGELGRSYAYFSIPDNRLSSPLENGEYILSFDYTTTDNDGGLVRISGRGGMALESVYYYNNIVNKMGYWQRGFIPFEIKKNSQNLFLLIEPPNGSGSLLIKNIVVVRGTKLATDLPAPEDQVADWSETNTEAFSFIKNKPTAQDFCEEVVTKNVSEIIDLQKLEPTTPQSIQDNPSGFQYITCDLSLNSHYSHLKGKFPQGIPLNEYRLQVTPNQNFKVYEVDSLMKFLENKNYSIIDSIQFEKGIKYDITDYFNRFLKGLGMPGGLIYYTNAYLYLFAKPGTITPPAGQGRVSLFDKIEAVKEDTISFSVCGGIMENRRMIDENKNAKIVCSDRNYMPLSIHTRNVGHRMLTITNKHTKNQILWWRFPYAFSDDNGYKYYTVSELRNIEGELNTELQTAIKLKYSKPNDKNSLVMYIDTAFVDNISFDSLLPGEFNWQTFDCPNDATKYVKLKSEYIERGGHFYNYYGVELPLTDYVYGSCMAENVKSDTVSINSFFVLKPRDTPSSAQKGTIYYDSTDNKLKCYDGTAWHNLY